MTHFARRVDVRRVPLRLVLQVDLEPLELGTCLRQRELRLCQRHAYVSPRFRAKTASEPCTHPVGVRADLAANNGLACVLCIAMMLRLDLPSRCKA